MRSLSHLGLALVVPFLSMGGVIASGEAAHAVDCSTAWQDRSGAWDAVRTNAVVRTGPHAECGRAGTGDGRTAWYLDCWTRNTAGNIWWHGRGSSGNGWVYEGNLVYNNNVRDAGNRCLA